MGQLARFGSAPRPAWPLAIDFAGASRPATLIAITGAGAQIAVRAVCRPGDRVTVRHGFAGAIEASVAAIEACGIRVAFDPGERAVAFALVAIAADMGAV